MSISTKVFVSTALLSTLIFAGCTNDFKLDEVIAKKQASPLIADSFSKPLKLSQTESAQCAKASCITIQKTALGKIFLLIASGKTAGSAPQWYDLKPLVVSFERSGGKVALLGQNYNSIYKEIETVNLIQSFDVISEDDASVTFDWGGGLKTFVQQGSYDVDGDRGEGSDLTESAFSSIPVLDSFIRNIKFDQNNIELEQISKVSSSVASASSAKKLDIETREETLAMNIQIRAYNLHSNFKSKEYDSSRRVGFFVTRVGKKTLSKDVSKLITKWDISEGREPILVRISAAVPEDYVQAVKEGAFYWNKVFGRDVITVETGVDPQAAPRDRSIMIRWVNWLDAGAAYAMGQSDPLTGEVLRAQVFMPAVFTKVGSLDLVQLNGDSPVAAASGAIACDFSEKVKDLVKLSREASDSQRLRLAQDSVRATVAHELGHALGLRHNFAGSFSAKVSTNDIYAAAKTYLANKDHQGLETSTSIMDYVSGLDDVMMSARIKYQPLSYDKMAMTWAYADNDAALDESVSKYCTDDDIALANSQQMAVYGCERFDAGNNPLLRKYKDALDEKQTLVKVLFASIIGRMYPGDQPDVVKDLDQVLRDTVKWGRANLDLSFVGNALFENYVVSVGGGVATKRQQSLASLDSVKSGGILDSRQGQDDKLAELRVAHLKEAGGYVALLNGLLRDASGKIDVNWYDRQVEQLKNMNVIGKGKTLSGRNYELTEEQQNKVIAFFESISTLNKKILFQAVRDMLPRLSEQVATADGRIAVVTSIMPSGLVSVEEGSAFATLALDLVTADSGVLKIKVGPNTAKEVVVSDRFMSAEERVAMLKILFSKGLGFQQQVNKANVRNTLVTGINDLLKQIDETLALEKLSDVEQAGLANKLLAAGLVKADGAKWLADELAVLQTLDKLN